MPVIVGPQLQTGFMENQPVQEFQQAQEFQVTYFDADCGRIRAESFDTREEAERFANRSCTGEDSWAVIDVVTAEQGRIAA
jgi:hypothetical protein